MAESQTSNYRKMEDSDICRGGKSKKQSITVQVPLLLYLNHNVIRILK